LEKPTANATSLAGLVGLFSWKAQISPNKRARSPSEGGGGGRREFTGGRSRREEEVHRRVEAADGGEFTGGRRRRAGGVHWREEEAGGRGTSEIERKKRRWISGLFHGNTST
jgi:hypothetical protein